MAERRPRRERDEEVLVWPDLVFVEFIAALLFTLTLVILSAVANSPLQAQADPNTTPNPSKAPWYFDNLQELLLHMNPALAGVAVPTVVLILLAAIPYYDRSNEGQGVWWGTLHAKALAGWSFLFSFVVTWILILYDAGDHVIWYQSWFGRKWPANLNWLRSVTDINGAIVWPNWTRHIPYLPFPVTLLDTTFLNLNFPVFLTTLAIPTAFMVGIPILMLLILRHRYGTLNRHDAMIALFTGFMTVWLVTTASGLAFRGQGEVLSAPWKVKNPTDWINLVHLLR